MASIVHHIALFVSDEASIDFYEKLGFVVRMRRERPERQDEIVWMDGCGTTLELFIDPKHPPRVSGPEAMGLRHLALKVENIDEAVAAIAQYHPEPVRYDSFTGERMTFVKDPDGQPIELHE